METNARKYLVLIVLTLCSALPACDEVANNPDLEGNLASTAAYFAGAWGGEEFEQARERTHEVLTKGEVRYELDCNGLALGANGASVNVAHYKASKSQTGSCTAKVDLFVSLPPIPGRSQSSASELTARDTPERPTDADLCPVNSFSVAGIHFLTWVEGGVVHVEGPGCTTTPGTTCEMSLTSPFASCSGDLDEF